MLGGHHHGGVEDSAQGWRPSVSGYGGVSSLESLDEETRALLRALPQFPGPGSEDSEEGSEVCPKGRPGTEEQRKHRGLDAA